MPTIAELIAEPRWLPHRIDEANGTIEFLRIDLEHLRKHSFLANLEPSEAEGRTVLPLAEFAVWKLPEARCDFIFHTSFCASTLLAKALTIDGVSVGLSEPRVLNDLVRPGARQPAVLANVLRCLARPWSPGGAVFVKPSNHANPLIPAILQAAPGVRGILLSNALERFLLSIHSKGLPGRSWARRLYLEVNGYAPFDLGMAQADQFAMSDIQVAGLAWLLNRRWFAAQQRGAGPRLRSLDAKDVTDRPLDVLAALLDGAGVTVPEGVLREVVEGEVFQTDSKRGTAFESRPGTAAEDRSLDPAVREEIDKVGQWVAAIARQIALPLDQPGGLLKQR